MKNKFNNPTLNNVVRTQKKHNLFNWVSPTSAFWTKKILKLILELVLVTWAVFTLVFLLFNAIPGYPKAIVDLMGDKDSDPALIQAKIDELKRIFHIDGSLFNQYIWAIRSMFDGTLGISWTTQAPVSLTFWSRFGTSILIGSIAVVFSLLFGIPVGIYLARRENKVSDILASLISVVAFSIPSFVIALLIVGLNSILDLPIVFEYGNIFMIILPALIISIPVGFGYTRYLRSSIRAEYNEQYVSLARVKGVSESQILTKHILKPALYPVINYLPFIVVGALFGSITIESVFNIPGTGKMLIDSALEHDQSSLLAITTFYTLFTVFSFFVRDLLLTFVDPRIRGQ